MLRQAIATSEKVYGATSVYTAVDRGYLGVALSALGRRDEALVELRGGD